MKHLKQYIYRISCVLISLMVVSCTQDNSLVSLDNDSSLFIQLQLGKPSRATMQGDDNLNENYVSSIDVFLFHADAADDEAAIFSGSVSENSIIWDGDNSKASFELALPLSKWNALFPENEATCKAYVIVNRPSDCALPSLANSSLSTLKHLVIRSSQFQVIDDDTEPGKNILTPQPIFVMDGFADDITRGDMQLTGNISVERAAVKIQLLVAEITDHISEGGKNWSADKSNVQVTLRNGCNSAYLNEEDPKNYRTPNKVGDNKDIYNLQEISMDVSNAGKNLTTSYPMYSYPTYWGGDDGIRTYIVLVVDWVNDADATDKKTTYYEIPVNAGANYLKRNTFYMIRQEVQIIGSETPEEPTVILPSSYVVLDWGDAKTNAEGTETNAEISKLRYLVVEEPDVVMQNATHKDLYYYSSNPIEITNVVVQKMNTSANVAVLETLNNVSLAFNNETQTYTVTATGLTNPLSLRLHHEDSYISLSHALNNNMDASSDYTEYIFTFDVVHSDIKSYKETVKVVQYPMIAIKADLNSDYGGDGDNNFNTKKGYVIINNNTSATSWYGVYQNGLANDGSNSNPNRYVISVSSLTTDGGGRYVIGDPRSKTNSVPTGINRDADNQSLQYYYPTQKDNTETMISPEFMVASSYGRCPNSIGNIADAEKRCATYQEDGYPAGRWRLATVAEIKYIVQLSGWGVIPSLFTDGIGYWSAHGCIQVNGGNVSDFTGGGYGGGTRVVRCVYDTWYWGTEQGDKNKFVYGDKQR